MKFAPQWIDESKPGKEESHENAKCITPEMMGMGGQW